MIINFWTTPVELEQYSIMTESTAIKNTSQIKYLGVVIDYKLSWQEHIEKTYFFINQLLDQK